MSNLLSSIIFQIFVINFIIYVIILVLKKLNAIGVDDAKEKLNTENQTRHTCLLLFLII